MARFGTTGRIAVSAMAVVTAAALAILGIRLGAIDLPGPIDVGRDPTVEAIDITDEVAGTADAAPGRVPGQPAATTTPAPVSADEPIQSGSSPSVGRSLDPTAPDVPVSEPGTPAPEASPSVPATPVPPPTPGVSLGDPLAPLPDLPVDVPTVPAISLPPITLIIPFLPGGPTLTVPPVSLPPVSIPDLGL